MLIETGSMRSLRSALEVAAQVVCEAARGSRAAGYAHAAAALRGHAHERALGGAQLGRAHRPVQSQRRRAAADVHAPGRPTA